MNNVVLVGRLVKDPELGHVKDTERAFTKCILAVERSYKSSDGEKKTDFIPVIFWGKTAEIVCEYLSKGRMISVSGKIRVESYEDKDGNKRYSTDIEADSFQFIDSVNRKEQII